MTLKIHLHGSNHSGKTCLLIRYTTNEFPEEYVPPCFWSVNLFGKQSIAVKHDNPAEPGLTLIEEELPAQSMFSWPFAVSFTRTNEQMKADGAYPRNLEPVRIPNFNNAVHKR